MARQGTQDITQEISDDNPEQEEVTITFASLVGKGIKPKSTSNPQKPLKPTNNPHKNTHTIPTPD